MEAVSKYFCEKTRRTSPKVELQRSGTEWNWMEMPTTSAVSVKNQETAGCFCLDTQHKWVDAALSDWVNKRTHPRVHTHICTNTYAHTHTHTIYSHTHWHCLVLFLFSTHMDIHKILTRTAKDDQEGDGDLGSATTGGGGGSTSVTSSLMPNLQWAPSATPHANHQTVLFELLISRGVVLFPILFPTIVSVPSHTQSSNACLSFMR